MIHNYRLMRIFLPMFLILNGTLSFVEASNRFEVHQNAFTFEDAWNYLNSETGGTFYEYSNQEDYFPVGWDNAETYENLCEYKSEYCTSFNPEEALAGIFEDAASAGMNFIHVGHEMGSIYPSRDDYDRYELVLNCARDAGLNAILGVLYPATNMTGNNNDVRWNYQLRYAQENFENHEGCIIGAGGMHCPDAVQYNHNGDARIYDTAREYALKCEDENAFCGWNLPFFSYLEHQGYGGWDPSWRWADDYIERYCDIMSLPSYDWYPCRTTPSWMKIDESADRCTAANIFPEDGPYFESYADRDELVIFNNNAGAIYVQVLEVQSIVTDPDGYPDVEPVYAATVPCLSWSDNLEISSSGSLSGDCGERSLSPNHILNGAVAIWEEGCSPGAIQILHNDDNLIQFGCLYEKQQTNKTELVVLGQDDYVANNSFNADGMICQDEMRILCCYEARDGQNAWRIYKKSEQGDYFIIVDDIDLESFQPAFGVWGYFWRCFFNSDSPEWPYYRSGFVLCNEDASQWRVIHRTDDNEEHWMCDCINPPFDNIENLNLNDLDVYRYPFYISQCFHRLPTFASHNDWLVGAFSENVVSKPPRFELRLSQGKRDSYEFGTYSADRYSSTIYCDTYVDHISDLAIDTYYCACSPRVNVSCNYYDSPSSENPIGVLLTEQAFNILDDNTDLEAEPYNWLSSQNCSFRIAPTRRSMTNALLIEPYNSNPRMRNAGDKGDYHTFLYPMLHRGIRREHEYGVVPDEEPTCLMTTIQAFGRNTFGEKNYCSSLGGIMYLSVSPIIHGARALIYYNLQAALEASYGGLPNRLPWEMTCWNMSRDTESPHMDFVSTVHNAVSILSGIPYGVSDNEVNFLSAIASDDWEALPGVNCIDPHSAYLVDGTLNYVPDDSVNFIALRNPLKDEVLVLVANDESSDVTNRWIRLSGLANKLYDVKCVYPLISEYAWPNASTELTSCASIQQQSEDATLPRTPMPSDIRSSLEEECSRSILFIDLCGLRKFSCALFHIYPIERTDSRSRDSRLNANSLQVQNSCCGPVEVQVSVANGQEFSISLFDLSGRVVSRSTGCSSASFSYSSESYNMGVYFVVLKFGDEIETEKILLLN